MKRQHRFFAFEDDSDILISSGECGEFEFLNVMKSPVLVHHIDVNCEVLENSIDSHICRDHETSTQKTVTSNILNEDSLTRSRNLPCESEHLTSSCKDADAMENSANDDPDEDPDSDSDYEFKVKVDFGEGIGVRWIRFG